MKLNDEDLGTIEELNKSLEDSKNKIMKTVNEYNKVLQKINDSLQTSIDHYNKIVTDLENFWDDISNRQQVFFDSKGYKWRQSLQGENFEEWIKDWGSADFSLISLELPEGYDEDDFDFGAIDVIKNVPKKVVKGL